MGLRLLTGTVWTSRKTCKECPSPEMGHYYCMFPFCYLSSVWSTSSSSAQAKFGTDEVAVLAISPYVLAMAVGPLVVAPLSDLLAGTRSTLCHTSGFLPFSFELCLPKTLTLCCWTDSLRLCLAVYWWAIVQVLLTIYFTSMNWVCPWWFTHWVRLWDLAVGYWWEALSMSVPGYSLSIFRVLSNGIWGIYRFEIQ